MGEHNEGGRPRLLDAAAEAAFLAALRKGTKVREAAKAAGLGKSTFYNHRRRCPGFAAAWDEAAGANAWILRRSSGQKPRLAKRRRVRFGAGRRQTFLASLARSCNTTDAAEAAGVHRCAVYRRMKRDPAFARAVAAALAEGYAWLETEMVREREREVLRRWRPIEPTGEPTSDFDLAMKLMARWERPAPRPIDMRLRRRKSLTKWEAVEELEKKLIRVFGPPLGVTPGD